MIHTIFQALLLGVVLTIACITDIKSLKIPNKLTVPFICVSLLFNLIWDRNAIMVNFIAAAIILLIGLMGGIGAGDSKLLIGCAFLTGWKVTTIGAYLALLVFVVLHICKSPRQSAMFMKKLTQGNILRCRNTEESPFAPYITAGIATIYIISKICEGV